MDSPYLPPSSFPFKAPTLGGGLTLSTALAFPTDAVKEKYPRKRKNFSLLSLLLCRSFSATATAAVGMEGVGGGQGNFARWKGRLNCSRQKDFEVHRGQRGGEKSEKFPTVSLARSRESARKEIGSEETFTAVSRPVQKLPDEISFYPGNCNLPWS